MIARTKLDVLTTALVIAVVLLAVVILLGGCSFRRYILSETEQYYLIPAGTTFNAVVLKGQPPIPVTRDKDTWAVDAGYLAKLQEDANANALGLDR